ncbi:flavin reductase like domain-containing protein [Aspergillus carlsbadensis]|nr:flavin reductase like domain-containing protein [Aspergillus carlsbadensis]
MKLLHSRALLTASRTARQYRGAQYAHSTSTFPLYTPSSQWCFFRSLTTTTPLATRRKQPHHESSTHSSLPDQVRLLMRRVPYPVAIITSTDPTTTHTNKTRTTPPANSHTKAEPPSTQYRGMTVSSFNTVTLSPQPVISFNVRRPSETLHALLTSGRFLVHLLSPTQETAALARDFARGNHNLALGKSGFEFVPSPSSSSSLSGPGAGGEENGHADAGAALSLPMLRRKAGTPTAGGSDAVLDSGAEYFPFIFECRLLPDSVVDVYDHTIIVGSVVRAITSSAPIADASAASSKDLCLTYADTRFWEVGNQI